jgi:putative ABC transport system ATP-binding protein
MIRVDNVKKTYPRPGGGEVEALRGVTVRVAQGEFVAVVGPSGSGKSTLLHAIGGLAGPTSGHIHLADVAVYDLGPDARAALRRNEIGFVFQTFNLVPYLTCLDNVALPAVLAGKSSADARRGALGLLERVGLTARRTHRPGQLSVGERQRVAIARALVNGPSLLLADEPTGNLDPATAGQVLELLRELNEEGHTLVMVTHDPDLAERAERVLRLEAGELQEDRVAARRSA